MEITPQNVRRLAEAKSDENWRFRSFLKASPMSEEEMDRLVTATADRVWAQVDCTQCANCCKEVGPLLDDQEVAAIARRVGKTAEMVIQEYLVMDEEMRDEGEGTWWRMRELPCAFLKDNRCSVYEDRPAMCRKYPYLHEPGFAWRTMAMLERAETCPIVYGVLEELKREMGFDPADRNDGEEQGDMGDGDEGVWHDLIDGFLTSERCAALPDAVKHHAGWIVDRFGFCAWQCCLRGPAELTTELVEELLTECLPLELENDGDVLTQAPAAVAQFVRYLGDEEALARAEEIAGWVEGHSDAITAAGLRTLQESGEIMELPDVVAPIVNEAPKIGRNDPCPCGSGKKYKKCCGR